jgi:hypothetical protein
VIAALLALVVVAISAIIAVRSAVPPAPKPARPKPERDAAMQRATVAVDAPPVAGGDPTPETAAPPAGAPDPDATQDMPPLQPWHAPAAPLPPTAASVPAAPLPPTAASVPRRTMVVGPPTVVEDLRLDDVLAVASEDAPTPRRPMVRLLVGVGIASVIFAGAIAVVARGIGALFGGLLK